MITFKQLIDIAPFDEQTRSTIYNNIDSLSEDQKREITELALSMIATKYQAEEDTAVDNELADIYEGKKKFSNKAIEEIQASINHSFAKKVEKSQSKEQIESVKQDITSQKLQ